jgi:ribosomal protein S24E
MDTNIGKIIKSTRDKELLLFKNVTYRKVHESKNCTMLCTVRTCIAKVYTSSENIIQIVKIVNENNGHDQPSIYRKIYSNGCKRKVMQNLYTKPSKILQTEIFENLFNLQTITTDDIPLVRRNMYNTRKKMVPPLLKTMEELQKAISNFLLK